MLIHNEFHDAQAGIRRPGDPSPANPCWYNSNTYAVSADGARTISKPSPPTPNAWIASSPGAEGCFNPAKIVRAGDGYYYSLVMAIPTGNWSGPYGLCVFRTRTLGDPARWRTWDGSDFNLGMTSPYVTGQPAQVCTFLRTAMMHSHVVCSTYLERYRLLP